MAIQQIQKSSTFKPDMIGDLVEVTVYSKADGDLAVAAGVLDAYVVRDGVTYASIQGVDQPLNVSLSEYTLSITHYEYILDLTSAEDDQ